VKFIEKQWLFLGRAWVALVIPPVVMTALAVESVARGAPTANTTGRITLACMLWLLFLRLVTVRMVTRVDAAWLRIRFAGVFIRTRIPLRDIVSAQIVLLDVRSEFGGYGIRSSARGKAYIARGSSAVLCRMRTGRAVIVGSGKPEMLKLAVESHGC
jgi:hypothetical protein